MGILTEEELNNIETANDFVTLRPETIKEIIASHRNLLSANAELTERNRLLVLENDELNAQVIKAKELMEWAARIIDSGMGAGILRYDPVQFFIDYHTYLKTLEELK